MPVAEILKENPKYLGASLAQSHAHIVVKVCDINVA